MSTIEDNILTASLIFLRLYSIQEELDSSRDDFGLSSNDPVSPSFYFFSDKVSERLNVFRRIGSFVWDYP